MSISGMEAREYDIAGRQLRCVVCEGARFWEREAQLNTAAATFFGFDWANTKATCMVCERCGYVHWFLPGRGSDAAAGTFEAELAALRQGLDDLETLADGAEARDGVLSG